MTTKPDLTRVWANGAASGDIADPDDTTPGKFNLGWVLSEVPPHEWFNFLQKNFSQALAHINEQGIPEWDTNTSYPQYAIVKHNGTIYVAKSVNDGDNPESTPASWALSPNWGVVRQSGGGALIPGLINYLQDSNTYTLPLANSVIDGVSIVCEVPVIYQAQTPLISISGSDDLESDTGVDPDGEFLFDGYSGQISFTSNGVDTWEI